MVRTSFYFKWCLYEASLLEYRTASKRLGNVLDDGPYTLYRRNSPAFGFIRKNLGKLPIVCSLILFFTAFIILLWGFLYFRYSAPFPHWLILPNFLWLLLPSFNSHQGLSAGHLNLFLGPTRIFVRVFGLLGRCMKHSWSWIAWATELLRTHWSRKRKISS